MNDLCFEPFWIRCYAKYEVKNVLRGIDNHSKITYTNFRNRTDIVAKY